MATAGKKIDSKLASYKNGQLMCVLCNIPVKNEMFWTGHIKGKQHLQTMMQLKRKAESGTTDDIKSAPAAKRIRPAEPEKEVAANPPKSILKTTQQSNDATFTFAIPKVPKATASSVHTPALQQTTLESRSNLAKLAAAEDGDDEMDTRDDDNHPPPKQFEGPSTSHGSSLPEGFFDDPKKDAKARGIDFVDPDEAEWSKFMKEIASEEVQSETIQVVDEEESRKDRELEEIEEMMTHWQKVIDLEKKKESRVKKEVTQNVDMESSSDEDIEDDLDWRIKKVSKNKNS